MPYDSPSPKERGEKMLKALSIAFGGFSQVSYPVLALALRGQVNNNGLLDVPATIQAIRDSLNWSSNEDEDFFLDSVLREYKKLS